MGGEHRDYLRPVEGDADQGLLRVQRSYVYEMKNHLVDASRLEAVVLIDINND